MLTVLIGPPDKELQERVRALVGRLVTAPSVDDLEGAIGAAKPSVFLLDLREQPGPSAGLPVLRRSHPSAGIVVLRDRLDPQQMLEAMRAGANEFLATPVTEADLKQAIERVARLQSTASESGQVFTFVGAKGGVGATTLAVNVATVLAQLPASHVLMIDLHTGYGDAALFFGVEARFSVLDALDNADRLDDAYFRSLVVRTAAGPHLLASSDRSGVGRVDAQRVRGLLEFAARHYSHVVVDLPRSDAAALDALDPASAVVIVANHELATVRTAGRMASSLRGRYGPDRVQVVVHRYDTAAQIGLDDIEQATSSRVRFLFPNNYPVALDALNKGVPLVTENHTKLASSISEFAKSLAGLPVQPASPKSHGFLGRLAGRS